MTNSIKQAFARYCKDGVDPFHAAMRVSNNDAGLAYKRFVDWPNDPEVKAELSDLAVTKAIEDEPPNKIQMAKELYDQSLEWEPAERIKAFDLVAKMLGYIERPAPANIQNNIAYSPVMVVTDHGDDAAWERKATAQQAKLIEHADD